MQLILEQAREDTDVLEASQTLLRREGADLLLNADVEKVTGENGQSVELTVSAAGQAQTRKGAHILAATGRRPNTLELRVDLAGVELTSQDYIKANERLQITVSGVDDRGSSQQPSVHSYRVR